MNVLQLAVTYEPAVGGMQTLVRRLSEGLVADHGDRVEVWAADTLRSPAAVDPGVVEVRDEVIDGVHVHRYHAPRLLPRLLKRVRGPLLRSGRLAPDTAEPLWSGPLAPELARLPWVPADVVVAGQARFFTPVAAALAKRLRPRPLVALAALHLDERPVPRDTSWALRQADACVALTAYEAGRLVDAGVAADRVTVVAPGVDTEPFDAADRSAARRALGLGDEPLVGYLGRLAPSKGLPELVDALPELWRRRPDTHVLLAGSVGAESDLLFARAGELDAGGGRVHVVPDFPDGDKAGLYAACDVVVNLSRQESFGIVFLEAGAARRPVVAARVGAVAEVVDHGVTGLLVDPADVEEVAEALDALLADEPRRRALGDAGRAVAEAHDWPGRVAAFRRVLASVVDGEDA